MGYGYIKSPDALRPTESVHRMTTSAVYGTAIGGARQWATTLLYGANLHSRSAGWSHTALIESEVVADDANTVLGRAEYVQKSAVDLCEVPPERVEWAVW